VGGGWRCAGRGCAPSTGSGEVHLPSYELFSGTEVLGAMAMERMRAGLSTRRYGHGLEPVGTQVRAQAASGMTNTQLTECAKTARYWPPHRCKSASILPTFNPAASDWQRRWVPRRGL
jgi:hypothetical protein